MGEIRLACPGCGTKYRLPEDAIPDSGREVECTACGHVWMAVANAPETDTTQPGVAESPRPSVAMHVPTQPTSPQDTGQAGALGNPAPISRRVSENVLNILRDEVEYERRARASETGLPRPPVAEREPPSTTETATPPPPTDRTRRTPMLRPSRSPQDIRPIIAPARTQPAIPLAAGTTRAMVATPAPQPDTTAEIVSARTVAPPRIKAAKAPQGYLAGFGLAAMVAALGLALYLMAPGMAGTGAVGDRLMQFRTQVDAGRLWLSDRASPLSGADRD